MKKLNTKNILYLDLEDTVIDEFCKYPQFKISNIKKIRKIILNNNIQDFKIFSFAIENSEDLLFFHKYMLDILKKELKIKFSEVIRIDIFLEKVYQFRKIYKLKFETKFDIFPFNTKESIFELYMQIKGEPFVNSILIDDQVRNKKVILPGKSYELIKI